MDFNFYKVLGFKFLASGKYTPHLWASSDSKAPQPTKLFRYYWKTGYALGRWESRVRDWVTFPLSITSPIPGAILSSPEIQAMKADVGLNSIWKDFILAVKS